MSNRRNERFKMDRDSLKQIAAKAGLPPSFSMNNCSQRRGSHGYSRDKLSIVRQARMDSRDSSETDTSGQSPTRSECRKAFDITVVKRDAQSLDTSISREGGSEVKKGRHQFTVTKVPKVMCSSVDPHKPKNEMEVSVSRRRESDFDELIDIF